MRKSTIWMMLVTVGCSVFLELSEPIPVWSFEAEQTCWDVACPDPENVAMALLLVDQAIEGTFGEHSENVRHVHISWEPFVEGGRTGITTGVSSVTVLDRTPGDVSGSALVHECLHVASNELFGTFDDFHQSIGLFREEDHPDWPSIEGDVQALIIQKGL